jgi:hypothetical protein
MSFSTSAKYGYTDPVWDKPYQQTLAPLLILFEVKAASDAHLWLSDGSSSKTRGYEILLGGWNNKRSEIRRGQQGRIQLACLLHDGEGPLSKTHARKFWISVVSRTDSVTIVVGRGWEAWKEKILVGIDKSEKRIIPIESVSVSTGFGSSGEWSLSVSTIDLGARPSADEKVEKVSTEIKDKENKLNIENTLVPKNSVGLLKRPRLNEGESVVHAVTPAIQLKASSEERVAVLKTMSKYARPR